MRPGRPLPTSAAVPHGVQPLGGSHPDRSSGFLAVKWPGGGYPQRSSHGVTRSALSFLSKVLAHHLQETVHRLSLLTIPLLLRSRHCRGTLRGAALGWGQGPLPAPGSCWFGPSRNPEAAAQAGGAKPAVPEASAQRGLGPQDRGVGGAAAWVGLATPSSPLRASSPWVSILPGAPWGEKWWAPQPPMTCPPSSR